jgi:hypothetical protein
MSVPHLSGTWLRCGMDRPGSVGHVRIDASVPLPQPISKVVKGKRFFDLPGRCTCGQPMQIVNDTRRAYLPVVNQSPDFTTPEPTT